MDPALRAVTVQLSAAIVTMAPVVRAHATKGLAAKAKLAKALVALAHVAKAKDQTLALAPVPVLHVFSAQLAL